jgi:hypothetical protein
MLVSMGYSLSLFAALEFIAGRSVRHPLRKGETLFITLPPPQQPRRDIVPVCVAARSYRRKFACTETKMQCIVRWR